MPLTNGQFSASFGLIFRLFYTQLTGNNCSLNLPLNGVEVIGYWNRQLCQLCHKHCPKKLKPANGVKLRTLLSTFIFLFNNILSIDNLT